MKLNDNDTGIIKVAGGRVLTNSMQHWLKVLGKTCTELDQKWRCGGVEIKDFTNRS